MTAYLPMDDLRRMALFAAVVDADSFTAAAGELGLSKSAVSKQVSLLEARYGVQLLIRTTRRLTLTDAGAAFYEQCAAIRELAADALTQLEATTVSPAGTLRVTAPIGVGEELLAPMLAGFLASYPDVELEITLMDEVVDLVAGGFDVAVRAGTLADSSLMARKFASLPMVLCAAPTYLAERGEPHTPGQLSELTWVAYWPAEVAQRVPLKRDGVTTVVQPSGRVVTNNGSVIRRLLVDGHGVSLLPRFWVQAELESGALVPVLPEYELPLTSVYALYPASRHVPLKVRAFIDALVAHVAGTGS